MSAVLANPIVIIDYGMGNLRSVINAFNAINAPVVLSNDHMVISNASRIVLPGVGAFKDGMKQLHSLGLVDLLTEQVCVKKKPFLGICLGMQLVCRIGHEHGPTAGLGWIDGEVKPLCNYVDNVKIPHVGWNTVELITESKLFQSIPPRQDFYFVHSYYIHPNESVAIGETCYGKRFVTVLEKDNIIGCQFHPEKSQGFGLQLLKNFSQMV